MSAAALRGSSLCGSRCHRQSFHVGDEGGVDVVDQSENGEKVMVAGCGAHDRECLCGDNE
jgi:hypothetical protein